jgi:hypothetical protein
MSVLSGHHGTSQRPAPTPAACTHLRSHKLAHTPRTRPPPPLPPTAARRPHKMSPAANVHAQLKLSYFPIAGRAEASRIMLSMAGLEWEVRGGGVCRRPRAGRRRGARLAPRAPHSAATGAQRLMAAATLPMCVCGSTHPAPLPLAPLTRARRPPPPAPATYRHLHTGRAHPVCQVA